jgi:hypothetical protein
MAAVAQDDCSMLLTSCMQYVLMLCYAMLCQNSLPCILPVLYSMLFVLLKCSDTNVYVNNVSFTFRRVAKLRDDGKQSDSIANYSKLYV